jgi:antibiotic biosynthesis monooxygenase (ABM) superfamily enzyme
MEEFVDYRNPTPGDDPPVTAVASRRVKPGREREFEEWISGIRAAVKEFSGYLGSEVLRPSGSEDGEYLIVFRFDHASNLHAWEDSEERRRWLDESRPLLHEEEKVHVLTGLETWFTLPSKPAEPPPPRYKMAMVTWLAVVPVVFVLFSIFGQWLTLLPALLRTLVFSAVTVTLMTYVIMPRMTRLFSFWLYPDRD